MIIDLLLILIIISAPAVIVYLTMDLKIRLMKSSGYFDDANN